jgi:Mn-dependent DtxR family transcriptional regulator
MESEEYTDEDFANDLAELARLGLIEIYDDFSVDITEAGKEYAEREGVE